MEMHTLGIYHTLFTITYQEPYQSYHLYTGPIALVAMQ